MARGRDMLNVANWSKGRCVRLVSRGLLAAGVLASGGCVTSGARERYQMARVDVVRGEPGDGTQRLAMWPALSQDRAFAWVGTNAE
ncbi:MAG: hypothetical protein SFY69_04870 [Planctomycetota bacterium]|nr:hypothetical protein [Planctomycetota bacterium]